MALELSQAELLDFLCQSGGRVANAALVAHFRRFLRDPEAAPEELQRRRDRFKGFVNSVATVKTQGPGPAAPAAKYVVLRKRYRELVGEEGKAPPAASSAASSPALKPSEVPPDNGRRAALPAQVEGEPTCPAPAAQLKGGHPDREVPSGARLSCKADHGQQREKQVPPELNGAAPEVPPGLRGLALASGGPHLPLGEVGHGSTQQRIQDWVASHRSLEETNPTSSDAGLHFPVGETTAPPPLSPSGRSQQRVRDWMAAHPPPNSEDGSWVPSSRPAPGLRASRDPLPVFRSIRCQLSLQDLEDFLERESSASEEGSSASGGSDSHRVEGEASLRAGWRIRGRMEGTGTPGSKGPSPKTYTNGLKGVPLPAKKNGTIPGHLVPVPQAAGQGNKPGGKEAKRPNADLPNAQKVDRSLPPPPNLEASLTPQLVSKPGRVTSQPDLEALAPDTDGPSDQRSSLVPLEPREHAWLVKVATGSWMQARALLLEDPHLAIRKDFISGYTVLHWLAKHGNVQVLLDVVTGAERAGVPLDVNVKSGCGYTPLHLAAMHGHQLVIKVLVQKLQCRVQVRDGSGKRPWQYLSSATSGEVWQLLGAPRGKTIFPARPITRPHSNSPARKGKSPELGRKVSRTASLAAYLKPQHIKWKMGNKRSPLHEREEYSD